MVSTLKFWHCNRDPQLFDTDGWYKPYRLSAAHEWSQEKFAGSVHSQTLEVFIPETGRGIQARFAGPICKADAVTWRDGNDKQDIWVVYIYIYRNRVTHDRWIFTDSTVSSDVSFWKVPGFLVIFRNQPDFFSTWDGRQQLPIFWARGLQRCLAAQCAKLPQLPAKTWSKVGNFSKNSVIFERIHDNSSINGLAPVSSWFGWFCNRFNIQFEDDLGQKHYVHQRGTQGRLAHLLTWRSFFTMLSIDTLG